MTTYTPITNAEIDQDSPITQPLLTALRDNPLAIAEGDATGPGLSVLGFEPLTAGDVPRFINGSTSGFTSSDSLIMSLTLIQKSAVRVKFDYRMLTSGTSAYRIELDGVSVASGTTTSTSYVSVAEDITLTGGNRLALYIDGSASTNTQWQNPLVATGGGRIFPFVETGVNSISNYDFS